MILRRARGATRSLRASAVTTCLALGLVGCDRPSGFAQHRGEEPIELEQVEVYGPPDSTLTTTTDDTAPAVGGPGVAGALPGGFPEGVPLYQPSSVIDFGESGSERYVLFRASDPVGVVRVGLLAEWEQAGWRAAGGDRYQRGGERIGLQLTGSGGGTEIRITY